MPGQRHRASRLDVAFLAPRLPGSEQVGHAREGDRPRLRCSLPATRRACPGSGSIRRSRRARRRAAPARPAAIPGSRRCTSAGSPATRPTASRPARGRARRRDPHGEGHQQQAPPHGFVDAAEPRLVVAGDEQLEGRHEVEEVLPHEAGGDPVAAGQRLDLGLVPAAALLRFLRDDQARAAQLGQVGRVALGVAGDEGAHVGDGGVVAEDAGDGVDEGALAVGAGAIGEDEGVLGREAGAAIADVALQEALQLGVAGR